MFVEREERKKSVYKRERLSRYVCVLCACVFVLCSLFFFFLSHHSYIYILNIILNILKTPFFLISSQTLFAPKKTTSKTPTRPTRRLDCCWATWRRVYSPQFSRFFSNRPTLSSVSSALT